MSLPRVENPWFLLFLLAFQTIFILIVYQGNLAGVFRGLSGSPQVPDFSKPHDVYTNLSLLARHPTEDALPYCSARSPLLGTYRLLLLLPPLKCMFFPAFLL